jgi:two-component system sensor histidine kinase DegS
VDLGEIAMKFSGNRDESQETDDWEGLKNECRTELEQSRRELKEISLMIEQSQLEVTKLQQRNASISSHLQQMQAQFDSMTKGDIRMAYDSALDSQQRLFVMRGQLDKLQSDQTHIERYTTILERVLQTIESGGGKQDAQHKSLVATEQTVEMMIQAQEAERQRLARQMHDGPAQALSNFILQAEIAQRLFEIDQVKAKDELLSLKSAATKTFQKVRDFIFELRPMMLDDLGLAPTLSRYVEAFKEQTGIDVRLSSSGMEQRLESYLEVMIFRAVQELLTNAARHSDATLIKLQLDATESEVRLNIEDNGKGFDISAVQEKGGMGLKIIRDRVEMLGGEFNLHSVVGQGTHISFQIPATKAAVFA